MADLIFLPGLWNSPDSSEALSDFFESHGHFLHCPELTKSPRLGDRVKAAETYILNERFEEPPVLIGHGFGGLVAQHVAASVDTGPLLLVNSLAPSATGRLKSSLAAWRMMRQLHGPAESTAATEWKRACLEVSLENLFESKISGAENSEVTVPILVLSGYADTVVSSETAIRLYQHYPNAEFHGFAGRGHWILEEEGRDQVLLAMRDWLDATEFYPETSSMQEGSIRGPKQLHHGRPSLYPAKKNVSATKRAGVLPISLDARSFRRSAHEDTEADRGTVLPR